MSTRGIPGGSVLRPPRTLRALAWAGAVPAAVLAVLAAFLLLYGVIFPGCCLAIAAGVLTIVATPILAGRIEVRDDDLDTRDDPVKTYTLPWREIGAMETRRRLLTEVVAVRRGDTWLELGAPRRWRFRADPAFTAAAGDLARRARVALGRGGRRTRGGRLLVRVLLAAVYVLVFVTLDPLWHSRLWPGRAEALTLPRACPVITATLDGGPATRPQGIRQVNRTGVQDVCRLGDERIVDYALYRYTVGHDGGIEQAEERYRGTNATAGGAHRRLDGVGDAADLAVDRRARLATVTARRANVVVRVSCRGRTAEEARAEAERLARAAAGRIAVR